MKRKKTIALFMLFGALLSCSEDYLSETDNVCDMETKSLNLKSNPYYVNSEGALCFETTQDFFTLSDSLSKLSVDEFKSWEEKIGFKSYRSMTDEIISEIYANENTSNYTSLLSKYSDIVYLDSDSIVLPKVFGMAYRNIINEENTYYIGDIKNTIVDNQILTDDKVRSINAGTRAVGDVLVLYPRMSYSPASDKRVDTDAWVYEVGAVGIEGQTSKLQIDVMVRGYSRNIFGTWKKYDTECFIDDLTIEIPNYGSFTFPGTRSSNKDCTYFTCTFILNPMSIEQPRPPFKKPTCLHYRARTRGTGNYGMAYNFINDMFFNVTNVTASNPGCNKHNLITYYKL